MWLDSLTPEGELATQRQRLQGTTELPEPTFWQGGADSIGPGLVRGALEAGAAIQSGLVNLAGTEVMSTLAVGFGAGYTPGFDQQGRAERASAAADQMTDEIGRDLAESVKDLRPDPRTTGLAGQLLGEAAAILPRTVAGAVTGGPVGAAAAAGAPAGYTSKQVAMSEGIDENTAAIQGAIDGVTIGIGAALPAARFVKPLAGDFAIAVGANVGLGVASRGAVSELLESRGYTEQAAQYRAFDGTAMTIDAVLGAAFFGIGRGLGRAPAEHQVNAALAENNAQHAELQTAPGIPVDAVAANTHIQALDTAMEQLSRGEPVRLPSYLPEAEFLRTDDSNTPARQELARVSAEQAQAEARLAGEDFAARVGRISAYDEATGMPTFADGTAYPLQEVNRFFDQYVAGTQPKDGAAMPDVLFQIGRVNDAIAAELQQLLPGFNETLREARISAKSVKHIMDSRPTLAREVLDRLERGVLTADEVLPNPQRPDRALLVLRDVQPGDRAGSSKHQSTVVELSANGKGVDVVSAMTMPDRTLNKARALKAEVEATRAGGLLSPSSLATEQARQPHAAAASEDSPTVAREASASIRQDGAGATDPEVRLADTVLNELGDIQVPTGAIDADGKPVTVSARELLAQADNDIQRAQLESRGIDAAAACALQRGE